MSVWGTLGKIGKVAGGGIASALTGGAALPLLIGGAAGFGLSHLGGGGKKDDQANASIDPYTALLQQQAGTAQKEGTESSAMGSEALAPAMLYLKSLLGADPSAMLAATQQERGRVIDQYDAARKAVENFGPRGGGTTSTLAQSRFSQAESLADITSSARRNAVASEAELGVNLKQLGLTAQQLASSDLNSVINAVLNRQYLDVQKRGQNAQAATGIGETVGSIIGAILTRDKKAA